MIRGVQSDINPEEIQDGIAEQNPELSLPLSTVETVIRPIFKQGPRDRGSQIGLWK